LFYFAAATVVYFADKFVNVQCTFEDSNFMCGYVTSELGRWRWSLETGKDNNLLSGPESDADGNGFGQFSSFIIKLLLYSRGSYYIVTWLLKRN